MNRGFMPSKHNLNSSSGVELSDVVNVLSAICCLSPPPESDVTRVLNIRISNIPLNVVNAFWQSIMFHARAAERH